MTTSTRKYARRMPVDERRQHLMDAALRVLVRDGHSALTVEAIAREADVSRPVVYSAYDGLAPLLEALLDRSQQRGLTSALQLFDEVPFSDHPSAWAHAAVRRFLEIVLAEPDVWRPILGLTLDAPAFVRERIEETRRVIHAHIAALLAGRFGAALDADVAAHLLMVSAEQLARLALDQPEAYPVDRLVEALGPLLPTRH